MIKFSIKFSKRHKLKMKIAARSRSNDFKRKEFYKKNLSKIEYEFLLKIFFLDPIIIKLIKLCEKVKLLLEQCLQC